MDSVNVKREELLEKLRKNRENHRAIFLEAQAGYRELAVAQLDEFAADARSGKRVQRTLTLIEPIDRTKEYDRAITMLEMSVDETISLPEHDFQCYVLDDWCWKSQFNASNVGYSKTLRDSLG